MMEFKARDNPDNAPRLPTTEGDRLLSKDDTLNRRFTDTGHKPAGKVIGDGPVCPLVKAAGFG